MAKKKPIKEQKSRSSSYPERINILKDKAKERGGKCLAKKYIGVDAKYLFECHCGNRWEASYDNVLRQESWCPRCAGRYDKTDELIELITGRGGRLISPKKYIKGSTKYQLVCNHGHPFSINFFKLRSGQWCTECSSGLYERICKAAIEMITGHKFIKLKPIWMRFEGSLLELDGYCKELDLAFEHQGLFHYDYSRFSESEKLLKRRKEMDAFKRKVCSIKGIELIEIPELQTSLPLKDLIPYLTAKLKHNYEGLNEINLKDLDEAYIAPDLRAKIAEEAKKSGAKLLSKSYLGSETEHLYQCLNCLNEYSTSPYRVRTSNFNSCPYCRFERSSAGRKETEQIKRSKKDYLKSYKSRFKMENKNFNLIKISPAGLLVQCLNCKHRFEKDYGLIKEIKAKCPSCNTYGSSKGYCQILSKKKVNIDSLKDLNRLANHHGGKCLSKKFNGRLDRYMWECGYCKHTWDQTIDKVLSGHWCRRCSVRKHFSIMEINKELSERKIQIVTNEILKVRKKYEFHCLECENIWHVPLGEVLGGHGCKQCSDKARGLKRRGTLQELKNIAKEKGGKCLSKEYHLSSTKYEFICRKGHKFWKNANNLKRGQWCKDCKLEK